MQSCQADLSAGFFDAPFRAGDIGTPLDKFRRLAGGIAGGSTPTGREAM